MVCHTPYFHRIGGDPETVRVDIEKIAISQCTGAWDEVNRIYRTMPRS